MYAGYDEHELLIAKFRFYHLDVLHPQTLGYAVFDVLDGMANTVGLLGLVYDAEQPNVLNAALAKQLRMPDDFLNVPYFNELEVLPAFRGNGLTKCLLFEAERLFSGRA